MNEMNMEGKSCGNCGSGECAGCGNSSEKGCCSDMEKCSGGNCGSMHKKCPCAMVIPAAITLIGLSFLLTKLGVLSAGFTQTAWPILLIIIGVMKLTKGMCKCGTK